MRRTSQIIYQIIAEHEPLDTHELTERSLEANLVPEQVNPAVGELFDRSLIETESVTGRTLWRTATDHPDRTD